MKKIKVGLLPLYLKLYDDISREQRAPMLECMDSVVSMLETEGLTVVKADVCRLKPEFEAAAKMFIDEDIDVLMTYHLAYSPSLESIDAIKSIGVPVIVCDTTLTYNMSERMDPADIGPNHGIHGVMDMCNLLKRRGVMYFVEAGHLLHSDVIARCIGLCRAAKAAKSFKTARIGSVGGAFVGMGDFLRTDEDMKNDFGANVINFDFNKDYDRYIKEVTSGDIDDEIAADTQCFAVEVSNIDNYRAQTQMGLVLRKWANENALDSYTVNFLSMQETKMPFLEISKAMKCGIGYAGEGDVLTAGLVGALMSAYSGVTFTETFCPCWKNNLILMSHMGEMNMNLSETKPVITDKPFPYAGSGDTVAAFGALREGDAVFVNLAPMDNAQYTLIVSPVYMEGIAQEHGLYRYTTEGWMKPPMLLEDFLKAYSQIGGTHQSALVYDADPNEIVAFGEMMAFNVAVLA
jgi:L-arabinose isomerase